MNVKEFRQQINQAIMFLNSYDETKDYNDILRAWSILRDINESTITIEI